MNQVILLFIYSLLLIGFSFSICTQETPSLLSFKSSLRTTVKQFISGIEGAEVDKSGIMYASDPDFKVNRSWVWCIQKRVKDQLLWSLA